MSGHITLLKQSFHALLVGLAAAALCLALWAAGAFDAVESKTWDWRCSLLAAPGPATDDIVLVLLDQASLDWASTYMGWSWPWPREVYGAVADYCKRNGARSLAFDVLFTEPSVYGVEDDKKLGAAMATYGKAACPLFAGMTTGSATQWPESIPEPRLTLQGLDPGSLPAGHDTIIFPRAVLPVEEIAQPAAMLCNVYLNPDTDSVYRRFQLVSVFDKRPVPLLGLGAFLAAHPQTEIFLEQGLLKAGPASIPLDARGNAIARFRGPSHTHTIYTAAQVIESELALREGMKPAIRDREAFKDKYVLFGFSAPGLFDLKPSPAGMLAGVEIHATLLDNLLSGDFMRDAPRWMTLLCVFAVALISAFAVSFFRTAPGVTAISALCLAVPVAISCRLYTAGYWLPLAAQEAAVAVSIALGLVVKYATEGRQKRFITGAFKQYLSPAVIEQLKRHPEKLKLGGEKKIISIFFSDLQGFTSMSEALSPEGLISMLNEYTSAMTDIIMEEGGTVDKYIGDAIVAFWNAPHDVPDHAERAVRSALRCQHKLAAMRPALRERIGRDLFMRVGLNTGHAIVGNMGSRSRFNYTMIGDAVNLSSRLEGVNKEFGTYTMVSRDTREVLGSAFAARELGRIAVVGRGEPVTVYEPMLPEEFEAKRKTFSVFAQGLELFYSGKFREALDIFSALSDTDPPAAAYKKKCAALLNAPPQQAWSGVWVMTSK